jgi:hypothetical protein
MELNILENGTESRDLDAESKCGKMDPSMKGKIFKSISDVGRIIWRMGLEDLFMLMVMFMLEDGRMINRKDTVSITMLTVQTIKVNGPKISKMEKV